MDRKMSVCEEGILEEVKNYQDITFEDEDSDKKLRVIMRNGMKKLESIAGRNLDFMQEGVHKELLLEYCRYARGNMLEEFERNFKSQILTLLIEGEIRDHAEGSESGNV